VPLRLADDVFLFMVDDVQPYGWGNTIEIDSMFCENYPDPVCTPPPGFTRNYWLANTIDYSGYREGSWSIRPIPEPSTALLVGLGAIALGIRRRAASR
jgi:hypothetical protein